VRVTLKIGEIEMSTTGTLVSNHLGYDIFLSSEGFFINGLNGLGEPKKIIFKEQEELENWISEQFAKYLGR
jgi:hypothetical protein